MSVFMAYRSWPAATAIKTFAALVLTSTLTVAGLATFTGDVTLGDGTGSAEVLTLDKDGAGTSEVLFQFDGSLADNAKDILHGTDETLKLRARTGGAWQDVYTVANAGTGTFALAQTFAGNVTQSAASPVLASGSGAGSPEQRFFKSDAGTARTYWFSNSVERGSLGLNASENFEFIAKDAAGATVGTTTYATLTADWTFPANVTLSAASPVLTLGSAGGTPQIILNKGDANFAYIEWRSGGTAESNRKWLVQFDDSEGLGFLRRDASGAAVDTPLALNWTSGDVTLANDIDVGGDTRSRTFFADGDEGTGIASTIGFTNATGGVHGANTVDVKDHATLTLAHTVWVKFYNGTTVTYFPGFTD